MNIKNSTTPILINGGSHKDERGELSFINDFSLETVKRFYTITHPSTNVVRAWQGHKKQPRYFYVVSGVFWIACVNIDNWERPSPELKPEIFKIDSEAQNSVLYVPPGYANGIKAVKNNSKLISFCEDFLGETNGDEFRYDQNLWLDWNSLNEA